MTSLPRKITFQLTPLLDLLLIVIFAQYLEMRNESRQTEASAARADVRSRRAEEERSQLRDRLAGLRADLSKRRQALDDLQQKLATDDEQQKRLQAQRDLLARRLAEFFQMSEQELTRALKPLFSRDAARRAAEIQKLKRRIEQLRRSEPQQIVRHAVKYEELLKRCDIWEIHIDRRGVAHVSTGGKPDTIVYRATPPKVTGVEAADAKERRRYFRELKADFERRLFAYFKGLPQTKNTIIILLSEDERVLGFHYAAANRGIPEVGRRIATETGGRVQLVHVELGPLPFARPRPRE